jgi:hypothetical protein
MTWTERKADRRSGTAHFVSLMTDRRRLNFERRVGGKAMTPGAIRPDPGVVLPVRERRSDISGG